MTKVNQSLQSNVILTLWWRLVNSIKLIRSVDGRGKSPRSGNFNSCFVMSFCLSNLPTLLLTYLKQIIMLKQKDNIVYDSFSDKHWNMEDFFEVLADFYEGNPEMMAEELVQETSTNLLHVRDSLIGIKNVELVINN